MKCVITDYWLLLLLFILYITTIPNFILQNIKNQFITLLNKLTINNTFHSNTFNFLFYFFNSMWVQFTLHSHDRENQKKCWGLHSKYTISQKSSVKMIKTCKKCCQKSVTPQLNLTTNFCFIRCSTFLANSDGFQLCLKQSNDLASNAIMTSSIIINHETPYERPSAS